MIKYLLLGLGIFILVFSSILVQASDPSNRSSLQIEIMKGSSTAAIQSRLEEKGILKKGSGFALLARLLGVSKSIQAGRYHLSPADPLYAILWKLRYGKIVAPVQSKIIFPEGTSIYKMGVILKANGMTEEAEKFQGLVNEGITENLRKKHWTLFKYIPSESLEGYLYPDTYLFFRQEKFDSIVEKMLQRFEEMVMPFWEKSAHATRYSLHEILTLASIIEKEAKLPAERPIIASVFYNRLKAGMPLAADPTIKYALERPTKRVYLDQLSIDSLYNTYKRKGLPPGPICNPGIESIKAAVYPATTNYYFFVARADGSHVFSRTWQEHQRARQTTSPHPSSH